MHSDEDNLWAELLSLLPQKSSDPTKIHTLNRLAREQAKRKKHLKWLDPSSCTLHRAVWPISRLLTLNRRHTDDTPQNETVPVIVLNHDGNYFLIDGNNRLNKWAGEGRGGEHQVIIVSTNNIVSQG